MFLKDSWLTTLRAAVRSSLRDIGKGWFNLEETNWEVYRMSKISKLMESVRFTMQVSCDQGVIVFWIFCQHEKCCFTKIPREIYA